MLITSSSSFFFAQPGKNEGTFFLRSLLNGHFSLFIFYYLPLCIYYFFWFSKGIRNYFIIEKYKNNKFEERSVVSFKNHCFISSILIIFLFKWPFKSPYICEMMSIVPKKIYKTNCSFFQLFIIVVVVFFLYIDSSANIIRCLKITNAERASVEFFDLYYFYCFKKKRILSFFRKNFRINSHFVKQQKKFVADLNKHINVLKCRKMVFLHVRVHSIIYFILFSRTTTTTTTKTHSWC